MNNVDDDLLTGDLARTQQHLRIIESDFIALELEGANFDERRIERALGLLQALENNPGECPPAQIRALADPVREVLRSARSRQVAPTPAAITVLLSAVDKLRELLLRPQVGRSEAITPQTASQPVPERVRTLLVEDDFSSRLVLQTFLSRYGECHIAITGREAVTAFRRTANSGAPYHLICMDIMMPEMDGREAMRQIRAIEEQYGVLPPNGAKIIMTTTVDDVKEVARCFRELCDAYLVKPIDLGELLGHMKKYGLILPANAVSEFHA